jgi:heat shock protein HslJ
MRHIRQLTSATVAAALMVAMAGVASAQSPSPADTTSPTLADTSWVLTMDGNTATLQIDGDLAGGSAGCNQYIAPVVSMDPGLTFGQIATTMKACPEPQMAFEQQYLTSLATVADYSISGQTLSLLDGSGTAVLEFEAGAPATIEGAWVVTGYNNGNEGVETPPDELGLTADFAPDGTISGFGGCNNFGGGYSYTDTTIAIGPLHATMMFCEGQPSTIEAQYLAALETATVWSITNGAFELRDDSGALQVSFARP